MFLLVAATEMEMQPARQLLDGVPGISFFVTGVGPVETAVNLTKHLSGQAKDISHVVHFGVGGAYPETGLDLLDICLADKEILGDLGICCESTIDFFDAGLSVQSEFSLTHDFFWKVAEIFKRKNMPCKQGTFVTVNCTSGTRKRGIYLRDKYEAICENMEGASVARVCRAYDLPGLELRCISNMVEDRDPQKWKLIEACRKSAETAATVVSAFL
jgi:futalosine hydrolase